MTARKIKTIVCGLALMVVIYLTIQFIRGAYVANRLFNGVPVGACHSIRFEGQGLNVSIVDLDSVDYLSMQFNKGLPKSAAGGYSYRCKIIFKSGVTLSLCGEVDQEVIVLHSTCDVVYAKDVELKIGPDAPTLLRETIRLLGSQLHQ